jgi:alpha-L-rhamnosidase
MCGGVDNHRRRQGELLGFAFADKGVEFSERAGIDESSSTKQQISIFQVRESMSNSRILTHWLPIFSLSFLLFHSSGAIAMTTDTLRCEYRHDPSGIDVAKPRFSWVLKSDRQAERQTAYEVAVENGWDSGKVESDQTVSIEYGGPALAAETAYRWRVRAWDADGKPSEWSEWATFSTGLKDWSAKWIGLDVPPDTSPFNTLQLKWVKGKGAALGPLNASKTIDLPTDRKVRRAVLSLFADNQCDASVNGHAIGQAVRWDRTAVLDCASVLQPGENKIELHTVNSDFQPAAVIGRLTVQFENGEDLMVPIDQSWRDSSGADLEVMKESPLHTHDLNDMPRYPAVYLRKEFPVQKTIKRATAYITALGLYELHVNGVHIAPADVLTPGWTEFRKRVLYQTYDVTAQLHEGENAIGAILGDGWYASELAYTGIHRFYGGAPRLLAQLVIEFSDGTSQVVATDNSWSASPGPIRFADILVGCEYDARLEMPGWDTTGFNASKWAPAVEGVETTPAGKNAATSKPVEPLVQADVDEPIRRQETLSPQKITEPSPGVYLFDLGQNMVGWARLKFHGTAGQRITFRYGEMLNPDGTLYTANLRGATATDYYIANGSGEETFEPYFTFHGFRYVEVRGLPTKPDLDDLAGIVIHSQMDRTGTFECSSPLLNQLFHNIIWGQKGNYVGLPTDCPQRDERAGWTGDAQFFIPTAEFNFDVAAFFTRWLTTLCEDSQHPDGSFAHVAPDTGTGEGATAWGDAAIICTYNIYRTYDDTRIIADHFHAMDRLIDWHIAKSTNYIPKIGGFGDWLNLGGGATKPVMDTAYFAYLTDLMAEMAKAIGRDEDAKRYADLHDHIKAAFAKFFLPDGTLRDCSQTGYALAFTMNLVPDELREKAAGKFADEMKRFDYHLATGFIGTPRLLPALHLAGLDDIAYRVLLQETYPSWLFQVKLGATTMWERWDGWTPDCGFQTTGMNSFNHYAFGSVGQYLYEDVAGISAGDVGFGKIRIQPVIGDGLTWAKATYDSVRGPISSSWKKDGSKLTVDVTIPANTTATVVVPGQASLNGQKPVSVENGKSVFSIGSGNYTFESMLAQ